MTPDRDQYRAPEFQRIDGPEAVFRNFTQEWVEAYKGEVAKAEDIAERYIGTEQEYHQFIDALDEIEAHIGILLEESISTVVDKEEFVSRYVYTSDRHTVQEILGKAAKHKQAYLDRLMTGTTDTTESEGGQEGSTGALAIQYDGVILQPDTEEHEIQSGKGEWKEVQFEDRLTPFIQLLREQNIFMDDLIIHQSKVRPGQMRQVGYMHIQIPRIQKTVLLCNQVGEGTYVIDGYMSVDTTATLTKSQLKEEYAGSVEMVPKNDQWEERLSTLLFGGEEDADTKTSKQRVRSKYDVREIHRLREQMKQAYTPEEWIDLTTEERVEPFTEAHGIGEITLANKLGLERERSAYRLSALEHLKLGLLIWGEDNKLLQAAITVEEKKKGIENLTKKEWVTYFQKQYTPDQWITLTQTERREFKEKHGIGELALATKLGFEARDINLTTLEHLQLGLLIWGEDNKALQAAIVAEKNRINPSEEHKEKQIRYFQKQYTPEQWIRLNRDERKKFKEKHGIGELALATKLGFEARDINLTTLEHLQLGLLIWGEDNKALQAAIVAEKNRINPSEEYKEKQIRYFQKQYTPEQWITLTQTERKKFKEKHGIGELALATLLGLERGKKGGLRVLEHLQLGLLIWGEDNEVLKKAIEEITE